MKLLNNIIFLIFFIVIFFFKTFSQEVLIGIDKNPQIINLSNKIKPRKNKLFAIGDTLNLPFIDDFAKTQIYPDDSLWLDSFVFINSTYAINPLSIGVATFDAINADGKIYENAGNTSFLADELTSKPINLSYPIDSNIFISFVYQPAGIGNPPEYQDSLVLQYFSPSDTLWVTVWKASYFKDDSTVEETNIIEDIDTIWMPAISPTELFKHVILPVNENRFLQNGFQFRFRNYASLSEVNYLPSLRSNVDLWHIDYLRLDKGRTANDTIIDDAAFIQPFTSLLANYEAIPWSHYSLEIENSELITPNLIYKNNRGEDATINDVEIEVSDLLGSIPFYEINAGDAQEINPYAVFVMEFDEFDYSFALSNSTDSAKFIIYGNIVDQPSVARKHYLWNDKVAYEQVFKNYYAYDDGTAEYGYGVYGEGTQYSQVACKFTNYDTSDSLRGVMMYFNHSLNNESQNYFYIAVWDHNDTVPGDMLVHQEGALPEYNGINQFVTYILNEPLVVSDTFYIGWTKTTEETINIGFDKNRINNDKVFYNINGEWERSQIEGTVMIRPIFGKEIITSQKPVLEKIPFKYYPNPANSIVYFDVLPEKDYVVSVFDNVGRKIYEKDAPVTYINVSDYTPGVYFLRISDFHTFIIQEKILVIH